MKKIVLFIIGILMISCTEEGKLYVDQNVEVSGNGTKNSPYKTISEAAQIAKAGDIVLINDGTYREHVLPVHKGTDSLPIVFSAIHPGKVIITGADVVNGWEKLQPNSPIYTRNWNTFFQIGKGKYSHGKSERWGRADLAVVDGKLMVFCESLEQLQQYYDSIQNKTAKRIPIGNAEWKAPIVNDPYSWEGAFYNDIKTKKSYIWLKNGENPKDHIIEMGTRDRAFGNYFNEKTLFNIHLKGIVFRHCPTFPQRPAVGLLGENNYMEGCVIEENAGAGVLVHGAIKNCVIQRNGHIGGHAFVNNEESLWRENSWKPISRDWEAAGTKVITTTATFYKCAFKHNGGPGLWFDIDNKNCKVSECVFYENEGPGLYYEISSDAEIFNNLCVRNAVFKVRVVEPMLAWGSAGIKIGESFNINIHNNTCVGNKDGIGIREIASDRFGGAFAGGPSKENISYWSHDIQIERNLLVNNSRKKEEKGGLGFALSLWYATENFGPNEWESNEKLEYSEWVNTLKPSTKVKDPRTENFTVKDNWMVVAPENNAFLLGVPWKRLSKQFKTIEAFEKETKWQDTGKIIEEAPFVDAANDNYSIDKDSKVAKNNIGWVNAPENIDDWITSFIPEYALKTDEIK